LKGATHEKISIAQNGVAHGRRFIIRGWMRRLSGKAGGGS
jgi:hypothetical protein